MFRGTVSILFLMIVGEVTGLLMIILATRMLSLDMSGLLILLQNNLMLFGTMATLGLGTAYQRFLPTYIHEGRMDDARALIRTILGAALVAAVASGVIFLILQNSAPRLGPLGWGTQAAFMLCIIGWAFMTLNRQMMRALKLTFWSDFSYQMIRPLGGLVILAIGVIFLPPIAAIFLALLLPLLGALIHDAWRIWPLIGRRLSGPHSADMGTWRKSAGYFTVVMMNRVLMQRLDLLVVGAVLGLEAAAIYGIVAKVSILAAVLVEPVQSMFRPRTSLHFSTGDHTALRKDIIQGVLWTASLSLLITAILLVAPGFWLQVFGKAFDPALSVPLLGIMLVGRMMTANSATAQSLSIMAGFERQQAILSSVIVLILYPPLLYWAIVSHGLIGAAVCTLVFRATLSTIRIFLAKRNTGYWGLVWPSPTNLRVAFAPLGGLLRKLKR